MRLNTPVNNHEYLLAEGSAIISRTDTKGNIIHCNEEFVVASGYERSELIGQPHNLIRHPDMPEEAFRDMWSTLKKGKPWSGLVKNRRKDGGFYWVRANATPLPDGSGYMSVRIRPSREECQAAEALYAKMRADSSIQLLEGAVVKRNSLLTPFKPIIALWQRSVKTRVMSASLVMFAFLAFMAFWATNVIHSSGAEGKRFQRIVASKDLLADILPPPDFIIESYLTVLEMKSQTAVQAWESVDKLKALQEEFNARQDYWMNRPDFSRHFIDIQLSVLRRSNESTIY